MLLGNPASFRIYTIEVLSNSTEAFDRGDKFMDYQALDSLEEYALVNNRHQRVECFQRNDAGLWVLQSYTPDTGQFHLGSVNFTSTFSALYEDASIEAPLQQFSIWHCGF